VNAKTVRPKTARSWSHATHISESPVVVTMQSNWIYRKIYDSSCYTSADRYQELIINFVFFWEIAYQENLFENCGIGGTCSLLKYANVVQSLRQSRVFVVTWRFFKILCTKAIEMHHLNCNRILSFVFQTLRKKLSIKLHCHMWKRLNACIAECDGHFQHLLYQRVCFLILTFRRRNYFFNFSTPCI